MGIGKDIESRNAASADDTQISVAQLASEFTSTKMDSALNKRYVDRAFFSMMEDAISGESEPIGVINKRLFREDEEIPLVDEIQINKAFVTRLLGNGD